MLPNGDLLEVTDAQPDLMRLMRSSYCTFGVAYEVTYRIRPLLPMAVYHETFTLDEFGAKLEEFPLRVGTVNKALSGGRRLHSGAATPVVALQAQSQAMKGRGPPALAPLRILWLVRLSRLEHAVSWTKA